MKITATCLCTVLLSFFFLSCTVNKAKTDNTLKKYFNEKAVDGCFTLLNNTDGGITVYNMNLDTLRFSPASTFSIVNTLVGLQTGRITDEKMVIPWDGVARKEDSCNKDMDLTASFGLNCDPWFQQVARRIGKDTLQRWVDSIGYGNKNMRGPVDSCWFNNTLKISPDEQLGLVKKLYFDQLPFRKSVQQMVRDLMLREDNTAYKLSYSTGLGSDEPGKAIGWVTGWVEENKHVYFFVTFVRASNPGPELGKVPMDITRGILKHLGFLEGRK